MAATQRLHLPFPSLRHAKPLSTISLHCTAAIQPATGYFDIRQTAYTMTNSFAQTIDTKLQSGGLHSPSSSSPPPTRAIRLCVVTLR